MPNDNQKRPWVKYAPSPSSASPTTSCLKRSADELDSSIEVGAHCLLIRLYPRVKSLWNYPQSHCKGYHIYLEEIEIYIVSPKTSTILLEPCQRFAHLVRLRLGMSPLSHATLRFSTSGVWGLGCEYCDAVCVKIDDFDIFKYGVSKENLESKGLNGSDVFCIVAQHPSQTHLDIFT